MAVRCQSSTMLACSLLQRRLGSKVSKRHIANAVAVAFGRDQHWSKSVIVMAVWRVLDRNAFAGPHYELRVRRSVLAKYETFRP